MPNLQLGFDPMSALNLSYQGPRTRLVRMNLLVACVALVPPALEAVLWLSITLAKYVGDAAMLPGAVASMFLVAIGENAYLVCFPILLAGLFVRQLFLAPDIPWRVKKTTALFVAAALLIMLANVGMLYVQYRRGRFRGFFR